jgi:hypothetical protein
MSWLSGHRFSSSTLDFGLSRQLGSQRISRNLMALGDLLAKSANSFLTGEVRIPAGFVDRIVGLEKAVYQGVP